jgi:hypothetical protein
MGIFFTLKLNMTIKAVRATIKLGNIELDVLQFPDGTYHFFINQLNEVLAIKASDSTGKKYLQPLIDKDPNRVNTAHIEGIKSNLKTLSMDLVSEAIQIYAGLGNSKCLAVAIACMSEALERRADSAFGVQRSEDERNNRLAARLKGKIARRNLTDSIQDWMIRHPEQCSENYQRFIYANCSDKLNRTILGAKSSDCKTQLAIPKNSLLRDYIPFNALRELELIEEFTTRLIDEDEIEPLEATKQACIVMKAKNIGLDS